MKYLLLLTIQWFVFGLGMSQSPPELYVFLPSNYQPQQVKRVIEKSHPNLTITVFGRYRDFETQLTTLPPDAILSLPPVTQKFEDYKVAFRGSRGSLKEEHYILVSRESTVIDVSKLNELRLGVIRMLDRNNLKKFLAKKLGGATPKYKTAGKLDGLLSLLQFSDVDAVFIPESNFPYFDRTNMKLKITQLGDIKASFPVLAIGKRDTSVKDVISQAFNNSPPVELGIDRWEKAGE